MTSRGLTRVVLPTTTYKHPHEVILHYLLQNIHLLVSIANEKKQQKEIYMMIKVCCKVNMHLTEHSNESE